MPEIARLIGGAGTGKTRELMAIMQKSSSLLDNDPHRIGFVSFTRAACDEAAARAAEAYNAPAAEFRQTGWFKTLHGIVYRCLGVGKELLAADGEGQRWLEAAMQVEARPAGDEPGADGERFSPEASDASRALALWDYSRNRLCTLADAVNEAAVCDDRIPSVAECRRLVERYEQAKRLDGRMDFTDTLGRFAGWHFTIDGPEPCDPDGEPPQTIKDWIHDEMQDSSPLLDACFRRMIAAPAVRWVHLAADPYQAIYGWNGGDHRIFMHGYPAAKERIMPKSWRCAADILALGEAILRDCSDYFDRRIAPAGPGGDIDTAQLGSDEWLSAVAGAYENGDETWLVLARTNYEASRLARRLDEENIPWAPTKPDIGCRWKAPAKLAAVDALLTLQAGAWIDGAQWQRCLDYLPAKSQGAELLVRGAKAFWDGIKPDEARERWPWIQLADLPTVGAAQPLIDRIAAGRWVDLVKGGEPLATAVKRLGFDVVAAPKVRLGTIHSAKGMEADNVALLTNVSLPIVRGMEDQTREDEEARVWYVACTRSRKRLLVIQDRKTRYRKALPI